MIRCSFKPYEGDEAYTFISYSHKDKALVFPILERMAEDGYNIWYDEGIDPGSEWPETIANHLDNCSSFIAFISNNSLSSANCRREINFALKKNKPFISIVLEEVEMSLGMDMQLSANQSIFKHLFENEEDFFAKLYEAKFLIRTASLPEKNDSDPENEIEIKKSSPAEEVQKKEIIKQQAAKKEKPKKAPKQKKEKPIREKKQMDKADKAKRRKLLVACVSSVAVVIALILVISVGSKVSIAGQKTKKSETALNLYSKVITTEDISKINKLEKLKSLDFYNCTFNGDCASLLYDSNAGVETVVFEKCSGITDYKFINQFPSLTGLTIEECELDDKTASSIEFSEDISSTKLNLNNNGKLTDISFLSDIKNKLSELNISDTKVSDLSKISHSSSLTSLSACSTGITNLKAFDFPNLTFLDLYNNKISDISTLKSFSELTALNLSKNSVSDISALSSLEKLTVLYINDNALVSVSSLAGLVNIEELSLSGNHLGFVGDISSLSPLSKLTKLKILNVSDNRLTSLKGIEDALNLSEINAKNNALTDINALENCTQLTKVNLSDNKIKSFKLLEKSNETLEIVYIDSNPISADISFVSGAEKLRALGISGCEVESLKALSNSVRLQYLDASDNKLTTLEGIEHLPELSNIDASFNQITNLDSLPILNSYSGLLYDFSNNKITQLPLFEEGASFSKLILHNNSIKSLSPLAEVRCNALSISIDGVENSELENLKGSSGSNIYIVDAPKDRRIKCEQILELSNVVFTDSKKPDENITDILENIMP